MTELAVLVPVLGRPHRVAPLLDSLYDNTPGSPLAVFICDPDDDAEQDAIRRARRGKPVELRIQSGNYATKINYGVRVTREPLIFLGADDLEFHPGWFEAAARRMTATVGVVGTQDLCNRRVRRGEHSTHSLVARWYAEVGTVDEADKLLHEGYSHSFVDDEMVQTAIHRGAFVFAHDSVVEHQHPDIGKSEWDETYERGRAQFRQDRKHFERRRRLWGA